MGGVEKWWVELKDGGWSWEVVGGVEKWWVELKSGGWS